MRFLIGSFHILSTLDLFSYLKNQGKYKPNDHQELQRVFCDLEIGEKEYPPSSQWQIVKDVIFLYWFGCPDKTVNSAFSFSLWHKRHPALSILTRPGN